MKYIFTCQENSRRYTLKELLSADTSFKIVSWLDYEVGLAESKMEYQKIVDAIKTTPIIFVRHTFRVDEIFNNDENLIASIANLSKKLLDKSQSFSVQTRTSSRTEKQEAGVSTLIAEEIIKAGFVLDVKNCDQAVSVYFDNDLVYVGVDFVANNLSKYKGGMPHFSSNIDFVSRSEFKLIEAMETFDIDTTNLHKGIDLGAAPGGWTKVLASKHIDVISVDPSEMDPAVTAKPNVTHFKMTTQEFLAKHNNLKFDILVNDMKMDVEKTIYIINSFASSLNDNAFVITTFKLEDSFRLEFVYEMIELLKTKYALIGARQLFHNRSEITVIAQKK